MDGQQTRLEVSFAQRFESSPFGPLALIASRPHVSGQAPDTSGLVASAFHDLLDALDPLIARVSHRTRCDCGPWHHYAAILPRLADPLDVAERTAAALAMIDRATPFAVELRARDLVAWAEAPVLIDREPWFARSWATPKVKVGFTAPDPVESAAFFTTIGARRAARMPIIDRLLARPNGWLDPDMIAHIELGLDDPAWAVAMLVASESPVEICDQSPLGAILGASVDGLVKHGLVARTEQPSGDIFLERGKRLRRVKPRADLVLPF